jgi:hypothetical protein
LVSRLVVFARGLDLVEIVMRTRLYVMSGPMTFGASGNGEARYAFAVKRSAGLSVPT